MSYFGDKSNSRLIDKPYFLIPILALFLIISIFLPKLIYSGEIGVLNQFRYPEINVDAYVDNDIIVLNITNRCNESMTLIKIETRLHELLFHSIINPNETKMYIIPADNASNKLGKIILLTVYIEYKGYVFKKHIIVRPLTNVTLIS